MSTKKLQIIGSLGQHSSTSVSLGASNWSSMTQAVTVGNITTNSSIIITPAPESHDSYGEAGVYCSEQSDGTLTFVCNETPTVDLTVNVLILN